MKVKFIKDAVYKAGIRADWPKYKAGDVVDFDDEDHANRWLRRGVAIIWDAAAKRAEAEAAQAAANAEADAGKPDLSKLTRAELELLAADRKVDIGQAKNKGEIVDLLNQATAPAA